MMALRSSLARKRVRRRAFWAALSFAVVALLVAAVLLGASRPEIEVATVTRGAYVRFVEEDGRTRIRDRYVLSAPLAGAVGRVTLRVGDPVAAGAVVAVIHPAASPLLDVRSRSELEQRVGAAQARVRSGRATLTQVDASRAQLARDHARAEELARSGAISGRELEVTASQLAMVTHEHAAAAQAVHVAEHELAQARAALRGGGPAPAGFELRAPVSGRVIELHQESETVVTAGTPIVTVGDPGSLEVVVDLLSTDAVAVEPGGDAELSGFGAAGSLRGRVRSVQPVAKVRLSALGVEEERVDVIVDPVEIDAPWRRVGHGYRVDVRIPVERLDGVLRVPTGALFRVADSWRAFVVVEGVVEQREVTLVSYGPLESVVGAGLREGEQVVVQPPDSLRDGTRVEVRRGP
jgi:HlyD family secretion protein